MDRFLGIDTLMKFNNVLTSGDFELLYNTTLAYRESQDLDIDGFVWADAQSDFDYEMFETSDDIEVMATYVDLNSPALPSGKQTEFAKLRGSIPRQKYRIVRGENDYRKELKILDEVQNVARLNGRNVSNDIRNHLQKYLFTLLKDIPDAHKNSLNYQVGQMKSVGALEITAENNPRGLKGMKFSAKVPTENTLTFKWLTKDSTTGKYTAVEGADPINDLSTQIRAIRRSGKYRNIRIELDEDYAYELLRIPSVLEQIGYAEFPNLRLSKDNGKNAVAVANAMNEDARKDYFRRLIGADEIKYHNTIVATEKLNAESKMFDHPQMKAFNEDVILIRPTGAIGKILNVAPLRPDGSAITAGIFGGRGIIEYIYNPQTRTQDWQSELTVLAVPNRPKDMFYIKGVEVTTSATE